MQETSTGYSPPQIPENRVITTSIPDDNQAFEIWHQLRTWKELQDRYADLPPEDRISPAKESQRPLEKQSSARVVFPSEGTIIFNNQIEQVRILEGSFGIGTNQRLAHNPAIDRSRIKRVQEDEDKLLARQGVIDDAKKHLYERAKADKSTVLYYQDDSGRIYNNNFPKDSSDVMWQRGLEYSKAKHSVDYEREAAEFEAWKEVMSVLFKPDSPVGSKAIIISGPGQEKDTIFTDNFVDIYTKTIDKSTGKPIVIQTRFASGSDYKEYIRIASSLDSGYFQVGEPQKDKEGIYFKRHPIYLNTENYSIKDEDHVFQENFKAQRSTIAEERIKRFIDNCMPFLEHYADQICADFFNPEKVKESFNAFVNFFDELRKGAIETGKNVIKGIFEAGKRAIKVLGDIESRVEYYGRQKVEEIMVGCGLSGGFSSAEIGTGIGNILSTVAMVAGTALGILESDSKGSLYFPCPNCGTINKRPKEGFVELCKNLNCTDRTKVRC